MNFKKRLDFHSEVLKKTTHPFNLYSFGRRLMEFDNLYDYNEIDFCLKMTKGNEREMVWQILDDFLLEYKDKPQFQKKRLIKFINSFNIDISLDYFD